MARFVVPGFRHDSGFGGTCYRQRYWPVYRSGFNQGYGLAYNQMYRNGYGYQPMYGGGFGYNMPSFGTLGSGFGGYGNGLANMQRFGMPGTAMSTINQLCMPGSGQQNIGMQETGINMPGVPAEPVYEQPYDPVYAQQYDPNNIPGLYDQQYLPGQSLEGNPKFQLLELLLRFISVSGG